MNVCTSFSCIGTMGQLTASPLGGKHVSSALLRTILLIWLGEENTICNIFYTKFVVNYNRGITFVASMCHLFAKTNSSKCIHISTVYSVAKIQVVNYRHYTEGHTSSIWQGSFPHVVFHRAKLPLSSKSLQTFLACRQVPNLHSEPLHLNSCPCYERNYRQNLKQFLHSSENVKTGSLFTPNQTGGCNLELNPHKIHISFGDHGCIFLS